MPSTAAAIETITEPYREIFLPGSPAVAVSEVPLLCRNPCVCISRKATYAKGDPNRAFQVILISCKVLY